MDSTMLFSENKLFLGFSVMTQNCQTDNPETRKHVIFDNKCEQAKQRMRKTSSSVTS